MITKALKIFCFGILMLTLGIPSLAQNTKGDKPIPNRETRFKTPKKSKQMRQPSRRVRRGDDRAGQPASLPPRRGREGERLGKPVTPQFSRSKPRGEGQQSWKGDITGRRIRPRNESSRAKNVYPQPPTTDYSSRSLKRTLRENQNPNVKRVQRMQRESSSKPRVGRPIRPVFHKTRPQQSERAWRGDITGRGIRAGTAGRVRAAPGGGIAPRMTGSGQRFQRFGGLPPRASGRARNIYSGNSFYVNNHSRKTPRFQSERSRVALSMLRRYKGRRTAGDPGSNVVPRSASAAYMAKRSTNTWAHFPRGKRKQERAYTKDLAGKRLRTKNFETQRPTISNPTLNYQRRMAVGERPYEGPAAGGHISRTRSGRAWNGDIAHRAVRGGFRSKKGEARPGSPLFGRGPRGGREDKYQGNIRVGRRGFGNQGEEYSGNIRGGGRPFKGGGSVSGSWNNKGVPIKGTTPGKGSARLGYSGNIKAGKRIFSDQGEEYSGNIKTGRRGFSDQGEEYTGNIKTRRPEQGGGSRSGQHWNNKNTPILVRTPPGRSGRIAGYQGNLKAGRRVFEDQGEEYSGNIKARRPDKGGGSVGGSWNNDGRAIEGRSYANHAKINRYSGHLKARRPQKGGESVSGELWNNNERSIDGKAYVSQTRISRYSGNVKAKRPDKGGGSVSGQLWNNDEKAILGRLPKETEERNFSGNLKVSRNYKRNPRSVEDALPVLKASAASYQAGVHTRGVRRDWDYVKNPSSSKEAQRMREPGRAFGRSADFQGNLRIRKFDLFGKSDLHPDARFIKPNKNNVEEEKSMLTNFKLWWARLFRKSETQPDHLKENDKDRKPRYDKGESGLWYE